MVNTDLDGLGELSEKYKSILLIAYLNINPLNRKIEGVREMCNKALFDILCVD